jgi:hypothetical protein
MRRRLFLRLVLSTGKEKEGRRSGRDDGKQHDEKNCPHVLSPFFRQCLLPVNVPRRR